MQYTQSKLEHGHNRIIACASKLDKSEEGTDEHKILSINLKIAKAIYSATKVLEESRPFMEKFLECQKTEPIPKLSDSTTNLSVNTSS